MLLASIYNIFAGVLMLGGLIACVNYNTSLGAISFISGFFCLGISQVITTIGEIAKQAQKTNEFLARMMPVDYSSEFKTLLTAANRTNELLMKGLTGSTQPKVSNDPLALYFYSDAQMQSRGPFNVKNIKAMLETGTINRNTPVALAGSDEWLPLSDVPELI